jgi:hypothetical protein
VHGSVEGIDTQGPSSALDRQASVQFLLQLIAAIVLFGLACEYIANPMRVDCEALCVRPLLPFWLGGSYRIIRLSFPC